MQLFMMGYRFWWLVAKKAGIFSHRRKVLTEKSLLPIICREKNDCKPLVTAYHDYTVQTERCEVKGESVNCWEQDPVLTNFCVTPAVFRINTVPKQ